MSNRSYSILGGLVVGALAWIDPLFVPLVLAGPLISGAIGASRGQAFRWVALAWAVGGATMLVADAVINQEDIGFHAILTVVMVVLAAIGWAPVQAVTARKRRVLIN